MHRKSIRATIAGTDFDVPIGTFVDGDFLCYVNGEVRTEPLPDDIVSGPGSSTDNALVRWDGVTGTLIQNSVVTLSDVGQILGVTALNTRDIARWTDGPAIGSVGNGNIAVWDGTSGRLLADSTLNIANIVYNFEAEATTGHLPEFADSTGRNIIDSGIIADHVVTSALVGADNRITRYDGTQRAVQSSAVSIDDSGNVTGLGTINTRTIANWVDGPASATDNAVARFDTTTGKLIQNSAVIISDAGAVTGVTTINGIAPGAWVRGPGDGISVHNTIACFNGTDGRAIYMGGSTVTLTGTTINNVTSIGGRNLSTLVSGPGVSVTSGNLVGWNGTTGTDVWDSGLSPFTVARNVAGFSNDNRLVRTDAATHASAIQQSGIIVDDSDNVTLPAASLINNTRADRLVALNIAPGAATPANLVAFAGVTGQLIQDVGIASGSIVLGPASATDNAVARFNATTGKLIQNSTVTIDDGGNVTGLGTINTVTIANIVTAAAAFAIDNRILRSDGTGRGSQSSPITIDDSGNLTGVGTINGTALDSGPYIGLASANASVSTSIAIGSWTPISTAGDWIFLVAVPYGLVDTGGTIGVTVTWGSGTGSVGLYLGGASGLTQISGTNLAISKSSVSPAGLIIVTVAVIGMSTGTGITVTATNTGTPYSVYRGIFIAALDP